ncbi:uncharacterized protein LOC133523218 [Cydia pomonella]|uniref:uncharacterized protein LOC133523218 n=1 Tax=Cydia pomonella TaxID=82600 RepID=UPI002ADDBED2|nr:uncharacterized protein LOC133523218 [Cydia pomonella]
MCQRVVCAFLLSLIACSGYVQETSSRNKNTDENLKNTQSYHRINGPKFISRKFTTHSLYAFNKKSLISHKVSSTHNFSTLKTRTLKYPVFNSRTLNLHKLNNHTTQSPIVRSRTLNSSKLNTRTLNYDMLNPYIPETLNSTTIKHKKRHNLVYDKILQEWIKDPILTLPDNDLKDPRRSFNEGLHDHKKRVSKNKEESRKRSENVNDNDIILNNKYELDKLRVHEPPLPNFNESYADIAAKKLNEIKSEHLKVKLEEELSKSARRFDTNSSDDIDDSDKITPPLKPNPLDRILDLMDQFIFQSHQKLINGQLLRTKYVVYVKYKIGYSFSLLRILKQQQHRIYSSMHFYRFYTPKVKGTWYDTSFVDVSYYLSLYEKMTRLDDDVITLVNLLWQLEAERKKEAAIEATKFPKRYKATPGERIWWWDTVRVPY